ncbi:MAG: hypothetical protein VZQ47_06920, partial [Treponema sp.]|nr:hypothetical protein [Treponema sp.]MEE3435271.1 hypothetical protein [Treponema sp.]
LPLLLDINLVKRNLDAITKNAPSCGCVRAAPLDNSATRALRLETIYVCRYRGMRNASVAASRPAPSRIFLLFPLRLIRANGSEKGQNAEVKKTARPL